eukprot:7500637-Prorocentrum_lima.AAC.1
MIGRAGRCSRSRKEMNSPSACGYAEGTRKEMPKDLNCAWRRVCFGWRICKAHEKHHSELNVS